MTVLQLIIIFAAASCRGEIPRGKGHSRDWQGGQKITIAMHIMMLAVVTTITATIIIKIIIRWNGWFHTRWTFFSLRRFSNNDWSFQPPRSSSCSSMVHTYNCHFSQINPHNNYCHVVIITFCPQAKPSLPSWCLWQLYMSRWRLWWCWWWWLIWW